MKGIARRQRIRIQQRHHVVQERPGCRAIEDSESRPVEEVLCDAPRLATSGTRREIEPTKAHRTGARKRSTQRSVVSTLRDTHSPTYTCAMPRRARAETGSYRDRREVEGRRPGEIARRRLLRPRCRDR